MTRESIGTFRVHRFRCDHCAGEIEHRSKGSGPIRMPPGWGHLRVQVGEGPMHEADVCSASCAEGWTRDQLTADHSVPALEAMS